MNYELFVRLEKYAEALVKERIPGFRKGDSNELAYLHSYRVRDIAVKTHHWDDPDYEMFLAALLHDVVEDGGVTFEELRDLGFPPRVIYLVRLCTHPLDVKSSTERWLLMMANLVHARDESAWHIKLADLADNLTQIHGLPPANQVFMREAKAPMLLRLTEGYPTLNKVRYELKRVCSILRVD